MTYRQWRHEYLMRDIRRWLLARRLLVWAALFVFLHASSTMAFAEVKPLQAKPAVDQKSAQVKKAAAPEKKKEEKTVLKKMKGKVAFIRKTKMAVEYAASPLEVVEMFLTIDPKVKLGRAKAFTDIGQGDTVEVKFTQTFKEPKVKGGEPQILSNVVSEITLLKKAAALVSQEASVPA